MRIKYFITSVCAAPLEARSLVGFILACFIFIVGAGFASADIQTEEVAYAVGDVTLKGYLAFDDSIEGERPGVLVVHEWWGHNDYARKRAEMLAGLGYAALAVDMYGDGKTADHPGTAGEFAGEVSKNMEGIGKERFLAALNFLKEHPATDKERMAAIGYCFGGGTVLHMARFGMDLDGVVSFHGSLATSTPAQPGMVKARVLVCHGGADSFVTPEQIDTFKKEMETAGVEYAFKSYEGATHSFTNPQADEFARKFNMPIAYNAEADQQSWKDMKAFFGEIFQ